MMQLQDPKQTKVLIVTLAETTPVLEAAQSAGRSAPRRHRALGVDRSTPAWLARPSAPLLRLRAQAEVAQIEAVRKQHAARLAVVPLLAEEPVGVERLLELAQPALAPAGAT